jgi:hypothetical protein
MTGTNIDTTEYSVEELIQLWVQGDLSVTDGEAQTVDTPEAIEVKYEGLDGDLTLRYDLSSAYTYRSDEETQFDIMDANPDVEVKPLSLNNSDPIEKTQTTT